MVQCNRCHKQYIGETIIYCKPKVTIFNFCYKIIQNVTAMFNRNKNV